MTAARHAVGLIAVCLTLSCAGHVAAAVCGWGPMVHDVLESEFAKVR